MNEYLITVTGEVVKHYLIEAACNEEAISTALDLFMEGAGDLDQDEKNINNVNIKIESKGDIDPEELE